MRKDVIIIGGGAAGLFCGMTAGRRGRSVLVIEHADKVGKKILISGGGRCNFTNIHTSPENFICGNRNFHKSALAGFKPADFIDLVEKHGIRYHEKKLGQLFCDDGSQQIVEMLLNECADAGVEIAVNFQVESIEKTNHFMIRTSRGVYECDSLVIATGGLSIPKMGATDFGHQIARQFGHRVTELKPALVPFTLTDRDREKLSPLSGISIDATVRLRNHSFRENLLVTHQGLSGPSILQISSYWNPGESLDIDLIPGRNAEEILELEMDTNKELKTVLSRFWPARFAQAWTELNAGSKPMRQITRKEMRSISEKIHHWHLQPNGTEGYRKAEVTAGGVDTDDLSSKTMESRIVPGLYFIGEVVDVTGHLGGFNFQWAWASGFAAGKSA